MEELLGYEEFRIEVYDRLSRVITNQNHIDENQDFYEEIIFKMFEKYKNGTVNRVSITQCVLLFDIFLHSMFENKPKTFLPEDLV